LNVSQALRLRSGSFLGNVFVANSLHTLSPLPSHQTLQVVAIWTIAAERLLIEKTLDTATHTDLVGIVFGPDRPAHLAMPAPPKDKYGSTRQTGGDEAKWPYPT
jgi:hypothetical protein